MHHVSPSNQEMIRQNERYSETRKQRNGIFYFDSHMLADENPDR
jgi:hypothetical protein